MPTYEQLQRFTLEAIEAVDNKILTDKELRWWLRKALVKLAGESSEVAVESTVSENQITLL